MTIRSRSTDNQQQLVFPFAEADGETFVSSFVDPDWSPLLRVKVLSRQAMYREQGKSTAALGED